MVFSYSRTISTRPQPPRLAPSSARASLASACSTSRSRSMTSRMPGRSTLTTTSRAVLAGAPRAPGRWRRRRAGSRSKLREDLARAAARGAFDDARARSLPGKGGTRSCSFASSSAMSAGSRSRRVETAWPNLTKIGPSSSSARRRRSPRREPCAPLEPDPGREDRTGSAAAGTDAWRARNRRGRAAAARAGSRTQPRAADAAASRALRCCATSSRRASSRSTSSRSASTPRRNCSPSARGTRSRRSCPQVFGDVLEPWSWPHARRPARATRAPGAPS